ncbi:MAG: ABC transporter ATP-binding protein, partial [Pseudomonadota bacterium]
VFQHFSVFEALNVAENIALALPSEPLGKLSQRIADISARYGLTLDPDRPVHTLSVGEKQRVEIIRCLLQDPKLLIMDEPTSVLTPQEADTLFQTLMRLTLDGCSILYISHKLAEVTRLCNAATILRHGEVVGTCDPKSETASSMAEMMVGTQIAWAKSSGTPMTGRSRLTVQGLSLPAATDMGVALKDVSLEVRSSEITAIAGVAGEGQAELMAALTGEVLAPADAILIDEEPTGHKGPTARRLAGSAFVPEERHGHAAIAAMSLTENIILSHHRAEALAPTGWIGFTKARDWVERVRKDFDVRAATTDPNAGSLSGGNLQKFVVGREILREPSVLVINQPTWGVDAGAAALIRQRLIDLAAARAAVLVISQDLEEIFAIAHRVAVMYHGGLSALYPIGEMTPEKIGLLMAGETLPEEAA